jgi:cytoskeletal protein CcmA (bactofilin family)
MFQKANKSSVPDGNSINLIGNGTTIIGNIQSNGDVRIDGILKGDISISGKLVVGPMGQIKGNVVCQNADISGEIDGQIAVAEWLSLKANAKLLGDIITSKISIEPNATFTGSCNMSTVNINSSNINETR